MLYFENDAHPEQKKKLDLQYKIEVEFNSWANRSWSDSREIYAKN
jgi:hypothetical protein